VLAQWPATEEDTALAVDIVVLHDVSVPNEREAVAQVAQESDLEAVFTPDESWNSSIERAWSTIREYETVVVSALAEAIQVVDEVVAGSPPRQLMEPLPLAGERVAAREAIRSLASNGALTPEEADRRTDRLLGLADAAVRLRTLIELHARGHVTTADLAVRRERVVETLAHALVP
jgi:hypothetical protein